MTAGGYAGRVLLVNLTTGELVCTAWNESDRRRLIGGYAMAAKTLLETQPGKVDPLGGENTLGFVTGPLTGTGAPLSGRFMVVCKSPLTQAWAGANCGGRFGVEMKRAGYDAVFIRGASKEPVYLLLDNGEAQIRTATHLWGKDTYETEDLIRTEFTGAIPEVACIGPAGERRSLISCILTDRGRAAGRCGVGAVMGSKRLKAIVAVGDLKTPVADAERLRELTREFTGWVRGADSGLAAQLKTEGTPGGMESAIFGGACPVKNWQLSGPDAFPEYVNLAGAAQDRYKTKKYACSNCSVACGAILEMKEGPYRLERESHRVEFETLAGFGPQCLNGNLESIIKANDVCNRAGLDTISASATVAFAMECYERGILTSGDTGGLDLTWGNSSALVALVTEMATGEGFGALLADGARQAAARIGKGAKQFSMDVGGQEVSFQHSRYLPSRATGYVVDAAPGRHTAGAGMVRCELGGALGPYPGLGPFGTANVVTSPSALWPTIQTRDYEGKGPVQAIGSDFLQAFESAGMCFMPMFFGSYPFLDCLGAVTGWEWTVEDVLSAGARGMALRQLFNVREGIKPSDFKLPERLVSGSEHEEGPLAGIKLDMGALTRGYFEARDWDLETGLPSPAALDRLGILDIVETLGMY